MDKLKDQIAKKIQHLGDSFGGDEDAMMDDMTEYIVSPYTGGKSMDSEKISKNEVQHKSVSSSKQEENIIDNIDAAYFIEEGFDAIDYELKKHFEPQLDVDDLETERIKLKSQLQVVSKKISELIMEKSPSYSKQMDEFDIIRDDLKELLQDVKIIRRSLGLAKQKSGAALGILANEKKKRLLNRLRNTLLLLKALYETEFQLRDVVAEGNFPLAIRIAVEAKEAATNFKQYHCVNDLMVKLAGSTKLIELALDQTLAALTLNFDVDKYSCVQQAYAMLQQKEPASRKLVAHFHSSLETSARTVVSDKLAVDTAEASYEAICQALPSDCAVISVREMCFVLTRILMVFHDVLRFHSEEFERLNSTTTDSPTPPCAILSYLSASAYTIFRSGLSALNTLISSLDFSLLKFDDIMDIVDLVSRFCSFGRAHFGHSAVELSLSLSKQTTAYFYRYHFERMFELKMFLESESFTLCPVPHQFTIFDLQDFHFLKSIREQDTPPLLESPGDQLDFQQVSPDFANPFGKEELKSRRQSHRSDRRSEDDPLAADPDDHIPPNLCNTALNVLRFFGRYLRMTSLLPSISEKSIPGIIDIFQYFFLSICHLFGRDGSSQIEQNLQLEQLLSTMESTALTDDISLPTFCCAVNLTFADQLFGAAERIMAIESLEFVARQLDLVRPVIEGILQTPNSQLESFYSQILPLVPLARTLILDCVASRALKLDVLHHQISATKWDIDELRSVHSPYVDFLLQDIEGLILRVDSVGEHVHVSPATRRAFYDRTIFYAFKTIVQGYCDSGKCSTEGRALMQLDLQHLTLKLEQLLSMKPIPHTGYVEGYIKAFYLPETGLEQWISQHTEYTSKQMISLLSAANHVSKKAKTRIINALSD